MFCDKIQAAGYEIIAADTPDDLSALKNQLVSHVQKWIDKHKLDYKIKSSDVVDEAISKVLYELQDLFDLTWN